MFKFPWVSRKEYEQQIKLSVSLDNKHRAEKELLRKQINLLEKTLSKFRDRTRDRKTGRFIKKVKQ